MNFKLANFLSLIFANKNFNFFFFILFFNLILRIYLAGISFGGGDLLNAYSFYIWTFNQFDYYSLFDSNLGAPPPYFPFTKFLWIYLGSISDALNLSFTFILKFSATLCDLITGLIILNYLKKKGIKNANLIFYIYIFNPLSLYITSQLGFIDSFVILMLVICCFLYDHKKTNFDLISFCLSISFCLKPFTLVFFPFFFINSEKKIRFALISIVTIFILNSFYLNQENLVNLYSLLNYIFVKIKTGHSLSSHGLGLLAQNIDIYFLGFSFLKIPKLLLLFILIYLNLFLSKKIKSVKFIFFNFLCIFIFMPNIHWQYFYWIIPFLFLFRFDFRVIIFCVGFLFLSLNFSIISSTSGSNYGLYVLKSLNNYYESMNFIPKFFEDYYIIFILIFYLSLFLNLKIRVKSIIRFTKKSFKVKNKLHKLFSNNFTYEIVNFPKSYLLVAIFSVFFIYKYNFLYSANKQIKTENNEDVNELIQSIKYPKSFAKLNIYGQQNTLLFDLKLKKISKNNDKLYLQIKNDYFYTLKINNKLITQNYGLDFKKILYGSFPKIPNFNKHIILLDKETNQLQIEISYNIFKKDHQDPIKIILKEIDKFINWEESNYSCVIKYTDKSCNLKKINYEFYSEPNVQKNKDILNNKEKVFLIFVLLIFFNFFIYMVFRNKE